MLMKFNKGLLKEAITQACDDIKNDIDKIIDDIDELHSMTISICCDGDYMPYIDVAKCYTKYITITDKIEDLLNE